MSSFLILLKEKLGEHNPEEVNTKKYLFLYLYNIQIEELILDNIINADKLSEEHQKTIEIYSSLYHLSLNNIGLISLDNFPKIKDLQIVSNIYLILFQLELNNNKLAGDDLDILVNKCPTIRKLKVENNNIDNFENLKKLIGLELKKINIKGNPCLKNIKDYRNNLFNIFLSLICIDDYDKEGNDIESTEYGDAINYFEEAEKTEEKLEDIEEEEEEEEEEEDDMESNNNDLNGEGNNEKELRRNNNNLNEEESNKNENEEEENND